MTRALRFLGLHDASGAERRATVWIGLMFFCSLASTSVLRPLRDQFGVAEGVERMPWLYSVTLIATAVCIPPFWWLANRVPSRRFVPAALLACAAAVTALGLALSAIGDYRWKQVPWLGELFWGGFSALNVILPSLVWIHAVEHFATEQGRRLFGFVAVGGTLGAVSGSFAAGTLAASAGPWASAGVSAALVLGALASFVQSLRPCGVLLQARGERQDRIAEGGTFAALPLLVRDSRVRGIAAYMLLFAVLATTFAVAQTAILAAHEEGGRAQHGRLANIQLWSQSTVLVLQLFCTGRLLRRLPVATFLVVLPIVSVFGLGAVWLWPTVAVISAVQIARSGVQHAFDKPAREVLYTALDLETKHKAKVMLDTFVFRLGDLIGAFVLVQLANQAVAAVALGVAGAWIVLGLWLGRRHAAAVRQSDGPRESMR